LEKPAVGGRHGGEEDGLPCSSVEEMSAVDGEGSVLDSAVTKAAQRNAVTESYHGASSFLLRTVGDEWMSR
jgi:hypothetical protein